MTKAQDQISQSMKEQAYNKIKTKTKTQELNDKAISIKVDGFNNFVEDIWSVAPGNNSNPLCSMAMKLKFLKLKIKEWNQRNMNDLKSGKAKLKEDLEASDVDIDKGNGTADMVTKRSEVVNSLQEIDKLQTMEIAQKAKIKWCIEGDENSSFFHGMLNKR
ncbi:hypothetical protein Tco_0032992 [Tanacetum coccineum]